MFILVIDLPTIKDAVACLICTQFIPQAVYQKVFYITLLLLLFKTVGGHVMGDSSSVCQEVMALMQISEGFVHSWLRESAQAKSPSLPLNLRLHCEHTLLCWHLGHGCWSCSGVSSLYLAENLRTDCGSGLSIIYIMQHDLGPLQFPIFTPTSPSPVLSCFRG